AGTQGRLDLLCFALEEQFGRLLQLALIREIGDVGWMLADSARFAGHLTHIAIESALVLIVTQCFELLGPLRECVVERRFAARLRHQQAPLAGPVPLTGGRYLQPAAQCADSAEP